MTETHRFNQPEGRLLAFYSAALAFSPAGFIASDRLTMGVEVTWIPWLNESRRRPSIDKPEVTNLAPFFPRPRIGIRWGQVGLEASWIPPLQLFGVQANVVSAAASLALPLSDAWTVHPRVWLVSGRVRGTITCAASAMMGHGSALETYYESVCHGNESDDWFEPRDLGGQVMVTRNPVPGGMEIYVGAGARVDRTRFDIGVIRSDGSRDLDHPVLALRATRPDFVAGASWEAGSRLKTGGELFYAPGSLLTARLSLHWRFRQ